MSCQPPLNDSAAACLYVLNNSDACGGGGFFDYSHWVWCAHGDAKWVAVGGCVLVLALMFLALSIAAEAFFCPCLGTVVQLLHMSENIAGVTFLAFGNGAPDIFSSLASVISSETPKPGLAFGALLGSGVFLTTFVVGVVTLVGPFDVMRRPLFRDILFYLVALVGTLVILLRGRILAWETLGFLLLYALYVAVVLGGRWLRLRSRPAHRRMRDEESEEEESDEAPPVSRLRRQDSILDEAEWRLPPHAHHPHAAIEEEEEEEGSWFRESLHNLAEALQPCSLNEWTEMSHIARAYLIVKTPLTVLLKLTIPVVDPELESSGGGWCQPLTAVQALFAPTLTLFIVNKLTYTVGPVPLWPFGLVLGIALAALVVGTSKPSEPPAYHKALAFGGFVMAVLWIYGVAREVVGVVTMLGSLVSASQDLLGLTLLAWSNSLGDLISDFSVARQGFSRMALSACIGGPLFNLLVGIGLSFSIAAWKGPLDVELTALRVLLIGFLCVSLLSSLILLPVARFRASRLYACYLLLLYAVFIVTVVLTENGTIAFPTIPQHSI